MKNCALQLNSISCFYLIAFSLFCSFLNAQDDYCGLNGGNNILLGNLLEENASGPYYIRIYVYVIQDDEGNGGQSAETVRNALDNLDALYNPHDIYFVRDCDYMTIPNDTYFMHAKAEKCALWEEYAHPDGITIFLDDDVSFSAGGIADGIPGTSLILGGTFTPFVNEPIPVIETNFLAHEMGHCLGLFHTHHGGEPGEFEQCGVTSFDATCLELSGGINMNECGNESGSNSLQCGDYVSDTNAEKGMGLGWKVDENTCIPFGDPGTDPNGQTYYPDTRNIMSYTTPKCATCLTEGQGNRMRLTIAASPDLQQRLVAPDLLSRTVTGEEVWTFTNTPNGGDVLIEDELIIEEGAVLTIKPNVTVRFGDEGRLIIKPNARLYLEGTLTGRGCGITWQGVEVWGNSYESQYEINEERAQGWLIGREGAVIENAEAGVLLYGPDIATNAGGLISCNGTTFRNCTNGVVFAPYENFWPYPYPSAWAGQPRNYSASFRRCDFIVDESYPHATPF